nr:hypothetical protein [uncultured Pseudomonas sp.]
MPGLSFAEPEDLALMATAEVIDAAKIMALVTLNTYDEALAAGFSLPGISDYKDYLRNNDIGPDLGRDLSLKNIVDCYFCKQFDPGQGHIIYGRGDILNLYFAAYIINYYKGIPFYKNHLGHRPIDVRSGVGRHVDNTGEGAKILRPFGEVTPYNSFMSPSDANKRKLGFSVVQPNPELPGNYTVNISLLGNEGYVPLENDEFHLSYYNGLATHPKFSPYSMQNQVLDGDFLAKLQREGGVDRERQINWLAIRRASKFGVSFFSSNTTLFYVLDGIDMAAVANKTVIQNKVPICTSELRYIFRNWYYFKERGTLIFLRKFQRCQAPWEENPALWAAYAEAVVGKYLASAEATGVGFQGLNKLWVEFFLIEIKKKRLESAMRYFFKIQPLGRTYSV